MKKRLFMGMGVSLLLLAILVTALTISFNRTEAASTWPTLSSKSSGENVRTAQYLLNARGYKVSVDGQYGPQTMNAVKSFQSKNGLKPVDGVVGPLTWPKLIVTVRNGSKGQAVIAVQRQLSAHGISVVADGDFGTKTTNAVVAYQKKVGLSPADGIVGIATWNKLITTNGGGTPPPPPPPSSGRLTHAQALQLLKNAGISVTSSGNCSNRNNSNCTSLDTIRRATIDGVIYFKKQSSCAITVTGGTETGHATGGIYTHGNGYKVDIKHTTCVTSYIHNHFKHTGTRGDGAPLYKDGNKVYADEGNHWDIIYP